MSGATAVATYELSKRYSRDTALDAINLRVPEGAVYVLAGANGAGKSTAMKVLMNLEGRRTLRGRPPLDTACGSARARTRQNLRRLGLADGADHALCTLAARPRHGFGWECA